ncbi:MAG: GPW/gp25 family protein [Succinivibrio sp.]|nr:GPW/gp25 family protein [Succinivibrio sp.]
MTTAVITPLTSVDFAPGSLAAEVCQNLRTILSTPKGSVPLDREFGLDMEGLDEPTPAGQMLFSMHVVEAFEKYEPRCKVVKVEFENTPGDVMDGRLSPKVTVEING